MLIIRLTASSPIDFIEGKKSFPNEIIVTNQSARITYSVLFCTIPLDNKIYPLRSVFRKTVAKLKRIGWY
jgi:hypothetical protein